MCNLSHGLDSYLIIIQAMRKIAHIFVAFSEKLQDHSLIGFDFRFLHDFESKVQKIYKIQTMVIVANEELKCRNLLGCDHWSLSGSREPTMVGFRNLVGVGIGPNSKKLAVKRTTFM